LPAEPPGKISQPETRTQIPRNGLPAFSSIFAQTGQYQGFWYRGCYRKSDSRNGDCTPAGEIIRYMTEIIIRRTGKLLFPHLARDQRNRRLSRIALVLLTSFSGAAGLIMWMASYRH
jgi:hypothetical protein